MNVPWSKNAWRRVVIYGLGRSGLAAARFLCARGVEVIGVDGRSEIDLGSLDREDRLSLCLGDEPTALPAGVDGVVLSPGVPRDRPLLLDAEAHGVPIVAEIELAFPFLDGVVVAVTGSNGKSTTASLVAEMLRCAGMPTVLGGNIGTPLTSLVEGPAGRVFVVELSSFQLESVCLFHPHAAALLNISPDHLDRYPDLAAYAAAKRRVFERQAEGDTAVLNADDEWCRGAAADVEGARLRYFSRRTRVEDGCHVEQGEVVEVAPGRAPEPIFGVDEIRLDGTANLENAMAAALLAIACGGREGVRPGVARFQGLPHRLQKLVERRGVTWIDDSKGTNVGATRESLGGLDDGSVHLILGGRNKGADFGSLRDMVATKVRQLYLIGEAGAEIEQVLGGEVTTTQAHTLARAVTLAAGRARPGEVVLLSPACASFDQFDDFEHRGRCFEQLVLALDGGSDGEEARL
jgi:UDP-N-acetylmuramoylalanine--D-glutamate ligase